MTAAESEDGTPLTQSFWQ